MAKGTCSVEGCERVVHARGWCNVHYKRWMRHGEVGPIGLLRGKPKGYSSRYRPGHPLADRSGYVLLHRLIAWEAGILTDRSLEVHHIDEDTTNNDPRNLEALTNLEHNRRHHRGGNQRAKTHCPQGHPYDEANTRIARDGHRVCRTCHRERERARKHR